MWLVRKATVASYLYSLCLLWVRECQRLLSLRAYPAARGVLELQGSREDRWLPVVYRKRQNLMGLFAKGNSLFTAFIFLCLYIKGRSKRAHKKLPFSGGKSKTFQLQCGSKLPQSWECNGSPHASQEYTQDLFHLLTNTSLRVCWSYRLPRHRRRGAGPLILILSIYSRLTLREGLKPDKHPAR